MSKKTTVFYLKTICACGLLFILLTGVVWFKLPQQGWFLAKQRYYADTWSQRAAWLNDYVVEVEAFPIDSALHEFSGLAYAADRNTLFAVVSNPATLVELSLEGKVLREIRLEGTADIEGVAYIRPGVLVVAEERAQVLIKVEIDDQTQVIDVTQVPRLVISVGINGNKGFEGLAYDEAQDRLFVAKERDPMRIYEIDGFASGLQQGALSVQLRENAARDQGLFVRDISGLDFDPKTGHLIMLSDESRQLVEFNQAGEPISTLFLLAGMHGLKHSVLQPEGVAIDAEGRLYVVGEPNLLYRFRKQVKM